MSRRTDANPSQSQGKSTRPLPASHRAETPISTAEVVQRLTTHPGLIQRHELDHLQRTVGNQAIGRLVQRDDVKIGKDRALHEKSEHIIGKSKRSSEESRQETEEVLNQTTAKAAHTIYQALTTGLPALKAFEKVSFAMAGHPGDELRTEYRKFSGRDLRRDFDSAFSSAPGPMARDYLDGCLFNNGLPTLRGRAQLAMGQVDSSGTVGEVIAKLTKKKIGAIGDTKRVLEMLEAAEPQERKFVWSDTALVNMIKAADKKVADRVDALIAVDEAQKAFTEATKGGAKATNLSDELASRRDEQLALMVTQRITQLPLTATVKGLANKAKTKITGSGFTPGSMGNIRFDAKKFSDDLLSWKVSARPEDLAYIQLPHSKFQTAMKEVPTNWLTGVDKDERTFITEFLASLDPSGKALSGSDTQVENVSGSLERQKQYVNRGNDRGWLKTRLPRLVADKKWRTLETEIKLLSAEQRKKIVDEYDPDPAKAIEMLEEDLKAAGFNKEERATIGAMFVTEFGDIGSNYADLKALVNPNARTTHARRAQAIVNPKKWTKAGKAFSGKAIGEEAYKIILDLEENEFVLVRNDRELLDEIRKNSEDDTWNNILDAMGMKAEWDQVKGDDSRVMVQQAKLDAEGDPKRWALILDNTIDEFKVMHNTGQKKRGVAKGVKNQASKVGVGRDKAQLYVLASRIQQAAAMVVRNGLADKPEQWMMKIVNELYQINADKVQYIHDSVPQMWDALKENKSIPVDLRLKRAKHEGFGVGKARKVDRQKVYWAFNSLSGPELLNEWSNIDDLRELHKDAERTEKAMQSAADDNERGQLVELLGEIYQRMQRFTLGISEKRRADLKNLGVRAEDRIKMEQMVVDKIADATEDDQEVQKILDELNLSYDDYMRAKMKGIEALEMQRYLDTTRQWHLFSTKSSQLGEGTRNVKGNITSTERKLDPRQQQVSQQRALAKGQGGDVQQSEKDREEIQEIRDKGAKATKTSIEDRALLEARFRDLQARLNKAATAIFKLVASAIIFAIISATTFGAGTPLAIGLHIGLEVGFTALQAAFQYFVLKERSVEKVAVDFAMNLVDAVVRVLTANLAVSMQASFLHPDNLLPGADWLSRPIAKQLSGMAKEIFMFLPKEIVAQVMHEKPLEKVIKEGEDSIADNALDQLVVGQITGFMKKLALAGVKEGKLQGEGLITGEGVTKTPPTAKTFDQAYNDRLAGGANQEEQEQMWGRYQKQYMKGGKKDLMKAYMMKDKLTKDAEEKQRKKDMKDMRKEEKDPVFKSVKETIERNLVTYHKKRGEPLLRQLAEDKISSLTIYFMDDEQKGALEKMLHMEPGAIEGAMASTALQLLANDLKPYREQIAGKAVTFESLLEGGTFTAEKIKSLSLWEKVHVGLFFGISVAELKRLIGEGNPMGMGRQRANQGPPKRVLPPVPVTN